MALSTLSRFRETRFLRALPCLFALWAPLCASFAGASSQPAIPLPEHPRPDFERAAWQNLNGPWAFRPDPEDRGIDERWWEGAPESFPQKILVPFPWGSKLSGVDGSPDIAWYARRIRVPREWEGLRVFLVVGACDWLTTVWLDGQLLGRNRGGYTPFEFELPISRGSGTPSDTEHVLVLRVDDSPHPFKLEGKQGYGPARGIWQTVYLEARPWFHLRQIRFVPDVDRSLFEVWAATSAPAPAGSRLALESRDEAFPPATIEIPENATEVRATVRIPAPRLWSLEDPFLYFVAATLEAAGRPADRVSTYFGLRKIGVATPQGSGAFGPYIALNGEPLYLQLALDQAYHPEGFYTFPSDEFVRDEILRARRIGLNGIRIHVKIDSPRKLYWADRLGILVMADVPNAWGEPDAEMRSEAEKALFGMIERDFNHPSIFAWVLFNETWGLFTGRGRDRKYLPETQAWVEDLYRRTKALDPTRLVEDNSPCNYDHVATDINSWHAYLPGYAWRDFLSDVTRNAFPGSGWNFVSGRKQGNEPLLNSECGNVWGYEGSTGDVDWSWDYHIMLDEFRRHPKIAGWLYTEHHDVINEWNGYYRYDRSPKITGLSQLVPGMSLRDLHSALYIAPGIELCTAAKPGETVRVPLWASFLSSRGPGGNLSLRWELCGWDQLGREESYSRGSAAVQFSPWRSEEIAPIAVSMPPKPAVAILRLYLEDAAGRTLHRNFRTFVVGDAPSPRDEIFQLDGRKARVLRCAPAVFSAASWSEAQTSVLGGLKVSGMGSGFFEYRVPWPSGLRAEDVSSASFVAELSAKKLHGKDRPEAGKQEGDFMLGKGTHDPSLNPNSYPMTDTVRFPSAVRVRVAGVPLGTRDLEDDPADHRGILSWFSQLRDRKLREAGSYGYLVDFTIPPEALRAAEAAREIVLRLEVDSALPGGLAIYGERFGRYPLDPSLVFTLK